MMEIRARYVLVGILLIIAMAGGFAFVYWLENVGGLGERVNYRIKFESPVPGLIVGSAVQFNGIRVGEVTSLALDPDHPRQVMATIAVASATPVRSDTTVGLQFGGLTGVPEISLAGGSADAPPLSTADGQPGLLVAPISASLSWTEAARATFTRTDQILAENSEALKEVVDGLGAFAEALGQNAERVDGILAGLERMIGSGDDTPPTVLRLEAPRRAAASADVQDAQLVVLRPTSVVALDTQWILVAADGGLVPSFPEARWADSLPRLVQATLIESFENAGYFRVGNDMSEVAPDYQLQIDLRAFQITKGDEPTAEVELTAKLVDGDGTVLTAQRFAAVAPAAALDYASAGLAINEAFGEVATGLVAWTLGQF